MPTTMPSSVKKKILFVHHGKGLGGAPLSLLYLVKGLDPEKYQAEVLFLHNSDALKLFQEHGITCHGPVNRHDFAHTKIWWFRWYHAISLARACLDTLKTVHSIARHWLEKIQPDLVHLNTSSLIAWGKIAHKMNIPVVWHIREPLAPGYLGARRALIKRSVEHYAAAIVPICTNDALPWHHNPKTHVVYNAVNQTVFDANLNPHSFLEYHQLDTYSPKILFVGGLSQEKGTLVLLKIFEKILVHVPQAQLLIAGYFDVQTLGTMNPKRFMPYGQFNHAVSTQLKKVKQSVHLLGAIKTVPAAMAAANVIVFPATVGHFARPIIEAGFMKKPVVASQLAPLDELVIHEKTGYLIAPENLEEWASKISLLLLNKNKQKTMGQAGFDFCSQTFSLPSQITKIQKIYTQLLKE
ncbi:glycosyltransferase family 4 protein [Candidatus Babeliales bacterium]|nr:glycosyltransferase family 4 protein [Candidatus Babeliales bacterium]